ncbi:helix-turn-helix domain-containing protein [Paraburkholderia heleia]|uniref:helix-turn-helix domain-containing protein n=1 Tax=Paraburkholderia heleia TaxID=634127 RepID=UPI002AB5F714|nr:helix-turn-helix transcriptional regulator [Paraburkholderia heleia]
MKTTPRSLNAFVASTSTSGSHSKVEAPVTETIAHTEFVVVDGQRIVSRSLEGGISIDDLISQQDDDTRRRMVEAGKRLGSILEEKQPYSIKTLRLKKGWSQQELADKVGMSQPQIARLERSIGDPRISTIQRLAAALDANADEIVAAWPTSNEQSELA